MARPDLTEHACKLRDGDWIVGGGLISGWTLSRPLLKVNQVPSEYILHNGIELTVSYLLSMNVLDFLTG
jgi:hypothetical protein